MTIVKEDPISSTRLEIYARKQTAQGTPATTNMVPWKGVTAKAMFARKSIDLGFELAGHSIQQALLADTVESGIQLTSHIRPGKELMQLYDMANYKDISAGTPKSGGLVTTVGAPGAAKGATSIPATSIAGLVGGTSLIQIGTVSSPPVLSDACATYKVVSASGGNIVIGGNGLQYAVTAGMTITEIDPNKAITHTPVWADADDVAHGGNEYYSVLLRWHNAQFTDGVLYSDCKLRNIQSTVSVNAAPMLNINALAVHETSDPSIIGAITFAGPDNIPFVTRNQLGAITWLGQTLNLPKVLSTTLDTGIPDDDVLFNLFRDSAIPMARSLNATAGGKFFNQLWRLINLPGGVQSMGGVIAEYPLDMLNNTAELIGTDTVPYGFGFHWNRAQHDGYDPDFSTNEFAQATIERIRCLADTDDVLRDHFTIINNLTTDANL